MADLALVVMILALVSTGLSVLLATRPRRAATAHMVDDRLPAVSIVRPLCGLEAFSAATLRAGFELAHPDYEQIFCVASREDPILPLLQRVVSEFPEARTRILTGDDRISANPKLNNCMKGWAAARHNWVILADSNVLMPEDYVGRLLSTWRPDTGLVCSVPIGSRPGSFWAEVECAFLNTLQARWQYAAEALGFGFAQGKSMLWYRPFLESRGGLRALASDIAEDAAATKLVRSAGLHVHLVAEPFEQPLGRRDLVSIWSRQLRWARLRRVTFPTFFAPEILSSPLVLAGVVAALGPSWATASASAGLLAAIYGAEAWLAGRSGWFLSCRSVAAFLVRDALLPALWVAAFLRRGVVWRGNPMLIATASGAPVAAISRA